MEPIKAYSLRLPESIHKELKIRAASEGTTMNAIIEKLIIDYLKKKK